MCERCPPGLGRGSSRPALSAAVPRRDFYPKNPGWKKTKTTRNPLSAAGFSLRLSALLGARPRGAARQELASRRRRLGARRQPRGRRAGLGAPPRRDEGGGGASPGRPPAPFPAAPPGPFFPAASRLGSPPAPAPLSPTPRGRRSLGGHGGGSASETAREGGKEGGIEEGGKDGRREEAARWGRPNPDAHPRSPARKRRQGRGGRSGRCPPAAAASSAPPAPGRGWRPFAGVWGRGWRSFTRLWGRGCSPLAGVWGRGTAPLAARRRGWGATGRVRSQGGPEEKAEGDPRGSPVSVPSLLRLCA